MLQVNCYFNTQLWTSVIIERGGGIGARGDIPPFPLYDTLMYSHVFCSKG